MKRKAKIAQEYQQQELGVRATVKGEELSQIVHYQIEDKTRKDCEFEIHDKNGPMLSLQPKSKDSFTLKVRHPLSIFQAFALCLSTFDK